MYWKDLIARLNIIQSGGKKIILRVKTDSYRFTNSEHVYYKNQRNITSFVRGGGGGGGKIKISFTKGLQRM